MPSSTFSSEPVLPDGPWGRTFALAAVLALVALGGLEAFWRARGHVPSVTDDMDLWSYWREAARGAGRKTVVVLGMSRMQLAFVPSVFREHCPGYRVADLCLAGVPPLAALRDLAEDESFGGIVLCSVTEAAFHPQVADSQQPYVDYFHSQWSLNKKVNRVLRTAFQERSVLAHYNLALYRVGIELLAHGSLPTPYYVVTHADRSRSADPAKRRMRTVPDTSEDPGDETEGQAPSPKAGKEPVPPAAGTGSEFVLERGACPPMPSTQGQAPSPKAEKEPVPTAEGMSESYSHFLSEGYHYPWYPAHSVDILRRPGKPLMGVFDNSYSGQGGDGYLQDMMQVLGRGVQGVGAQHTKPFQDPQAASAYRVGNLIAKMYGPIFAECPPANEAAVLYSYTQDVTEHRNSMGTPHWERVFALHTAGLMAGVPMFITFEEDIADGWLLEDCRLKAGTNRASGGQPVPDPQSAIGNRKSAIPRLPMLFLVGQTKPLPPKVQEEIAKFIAAGGKVFTDAESADFPGATKLGFKTHELKSLWHEGYAADTIYPLFAPVQEKLARELRDAVGQFRRFPVETDTPWVSKNLFDGGAIRYILLATDEGAPFPWDAGTVWSLGAVWRFSVLPTTATLSFPDTGGVVYDVFEHRIVRPKSDGKTAKLSVDLRTLPGRLYAIAPTRLGPPQVEVILTPAPPGSQSGVKPPHSKAGEDARGGPGGSLWGPRPAAEPLDALECGGSTPLFPAGLQDSRRGAESAAAGVAAVQAAGSSAVGTTARGGRARYRIAIVDERGRPLAARVPIHVRLVGDERCAWELYRGTHADGTLSEESDLPTTGKLWTLEVTELLGGKVSSAPIPLAPEHGLHGTLVKERSAIEGYRVAQSMALLDQARKKGSLAFVLPDPKAITEQQREKLFEVFAQRGVKVELQTAMPKEVTPGVHVVAGYLPQRQTLGDLLWDAWSRGLFGPALSEHVPGPGRGFGAPLFAPRGHDEHVIALVGGDLDGLRKVIDAFIGWGKPEEVVEPLDDEPTQSPARVDPAIKVPGPAPTPRLSDLVGARLDGVTVAADGKHLLVTAKGYLRNAALVEDRGSRARVERAVRIGQAPTVGGACVAPDGAWFGAAARVVPRFGEGFHLVDAASGRMKVFADFGDIGRASHYFAVSPGGDTVLAPGTYGVVCWKRHRVGPFWSRRDEWTEAWSLDYWKEFPKLDWPVSDVAERIPQFHAFIPPRHASRGTRHETALILFGEFSNQGWVTPDQHCKASLSAVRLADGKELWRFDVPILKTLLFPTLHASPDGSKLLLQVQMGSWNKETFRFFTIDPASGKAVATWDCRYAPLGVAVADATAQIALAFKERLLEMRRPDGTLVYNLLWRNQPVGVAFASDGQRLYVADDAGRLALLDAEGNTVWTAEMGCVSAIAASGDRVYAAGWDGRLRAFDEIGNALWTLDLTPALNDPSPMAMVAASAKYPEGSVVQATRPSTLSDPVPGGPNLLRTGKATLKLGGTRGWMSDGKLQVKEEQLTNGKLDDVTTPWLHLDELFWDATAGRQVWAEITFLSPTDVKALTVYENPKFPESWPTEGLVQVWNEGLKRWDTAAFGVWLKGPVTTYALNLKAAAKIRYVPWNSYYRNFYTSEIEVR